MYIIISLSTIASVITIIEYDNKHLQLIKKAIHKVNSLLKK